MTNQQHPITPPPELVQRISLQALESLLNDGCGAVEIDEARDEYIANFFAQWGADQELEACCEYFGEDYFVQDRLRAARRLKPPSLAEEALMALEDGDMGPGASLMPTSVGIIRRALERLQELEEQQ